MRRIVALALSLLVATGISVAGGPLNVTGPAATMPGQPFVWNSSSPIRYTVDGGPLSVNPSGQTIIGNAQGVARVESLFQNWEVSTDAISFSYAGVISGIAGGDVKAIQDFNTVQGSCNAGTQSPVIFDANGSLTEALGMDPLVIGFTSPCKLDMQAGHILSALIVMNGEFQDGVSSPNSGNYELDADQFDQAITHEMGHFAGLDHSQINLDLFQSGAVGNCNLDELAGLPLMFPVQFCQSRKSAGLPILAPDDVAWISKLYPSSTYAANYGTISGFVFFSDGITHVQGVNVIARQVDDPNTPEDESRRVAFSVVSGFLFTADPGQAITGNNTNGSAYGSRNPAMIGYYEIPVPPGTYTVETENIDASFVGGSSVGPLDPPAVTYGADEHWHHYESAYDDVSQADPITVQAGQKISNVNFILNQTPPRFDQFEDGEARLVSPQSPIVFRSLQSLWRAAP
ncbi:MAG TPA: hypothetical protein VFW94_11565 [Candidatus Acidoferrales bacterium]|nr:hypothetical protein [Candidatus Acidoferrales bacterium]